MTTTEENRLKLVEKYKRIRSYLKNEPSATSPEDGGNNMVWDLSDIWDASRLEFTPEQLALIAEMDKPESLRIEITLGPEQRENYGDLVHESRSKDPCETDGNTPAWELEDDPVVALCSACIVHAYVARDVGGSIKVVPPLK